jgi:hypothetical protein
MKTIIEKLISENLYKNLSVIQQIRSKVMLFLGYYYDLE